MHLRGMISRESIGRMMRRVRPRVRRCFRNARRGDPDYRAHVVMSLVIEGRELETVRVSGDVTPELQTCMTSAVDYLQIPPTGSRVVINYPFVASAEERPGAVELGADVEGALDRLF